MTNKTFTPLLLVTVLLLLLAVSFFSISFLREPVSAQLLGRKKPGAAQLALTVNSGSANVTIFDTDTNKVIATVPVAPRPILAATYRNFAWILSGRPQDPVVSKIDLRSRRVVKTLSLKRDDGKPFQAAEFEVSPDGNVLIVGEAYRATLLFIRASDLEQYATMELCDLCGTSSVDRRYFPVRSGLDRRLPEESVPVVTFSADGAKAYVAHPVDGELIAIANIASNPVIEKTVSIREGGKQSESYRDLKRSEAFGVTYLSLLIQLVPTGRPPVGGYDNAQEVNVFDAVTLSRIDSVVAEGVPSDIEVKGNLSAAAGGWLAMGTDDYSEGSLWDPDDQLVFFTGANHPIPASEAAGSLTEVGGKLVSVCYTRPSAPGGDPENRCNPARFDIFDLETFTKETTVILPAEANLTAQRFPAGKKEGGKYFYLPLDGDNVLAYELLTGTMKKIKVGEAPLGVYLDNDPTTREYLDLTPGQYPAPAPNNLTAGAILNNWISINWKQESPNEYKFIVERLEGSGTDFSELAAVGPETGGYDDRTVSPNTHYCYRVRAQNEYGFSGYSNEACTDTPP